MSFCVRSWSPMAEPFLFWFFRATNEMQPPHEWECYHLRPAHPAVSSKGGVLGTKWSFSACLLCMTISLFWGVNCLYTAPFHFLCSDSRQPIRRLKFVQSGLSHHFCRGLTPQGLTLRPHSQPYNLETPEKKAASRPVVSLFAQLCVRCPGERKTLPPHDWLWGTVLGATPCFVTYPGIHCLVQDWGLFEAWDAENV